MKRAFDSSSISDICERLKSALNANKSQIEAMRSIASQAESAAQSVPGFVTKSNISGAAQALRSQRQTSSTGQRQENW